MKNLLLLLTAFLLLYLNSNAQTYSWINISSSVPGDSLFHDLSDVYFTNDNEGWITSSSHAEIYHTTDGGATFEVQTTQLSCNAIWMLNENEGYAGGQSGFIYRTTDGGINWNFHGTITTTLSDITFPGNTGYTCGDNGKIYTVTSSGVTAMTSNAGTVNLKSITFPITTEGWACGEQLIIHYSSSTWSTDQSYPSGGNYNSMYFVNNTSGWAVGDNGRILHTTDGQNWATQTNPDSNSFFDVFFLNENKGWAVGFNGSILHTSNGGLNWTVEGAGHTTNFLRGVQFTTSTNGYVVGNNKTLLKYTQSIGITPISGTLPEDYALMQNYPNPFNPSTNIRFEIPKSSRVELIVYDNLGREIDVLVNERLHPGLYETMWDADKYSSGVYFYKLVTNEFSEVKKMILLK